MKTKLFALAFLFMHALCVHAQESRQEKITKIRQELSSFLADKKNQQLSPETEKRIKQQMAMQEPGQILTAAQKQKRYDELAAFCRENNFWKAHPDYLTYVSQRNVGAGSNLCANGGFEADNTAFTHFGTAFSDNSNLCAILAAIPFNPTIATDPVANVPNRMEVVTAGADPVVPGLTRTRNGNKALRINSNLNASGQSCTTPLFEQQIDKAATTFTVDPQTTVLTFWYAVVMQSPNHNLNNGQNPFFTARITDNLTGATIQQICFDPSQNNLQNGGVACTYTVLWQPWTCATFNLSQFANRLVTLEFIAADCGQGGHFGYAYVDDICMGCGTPGNTGGITIASNDNCFTNGISFTGTYTLPTTAGSALQGISVQLRKDGSAITNIPVTGVSGSYSGTVPGNLMTANAGYDLVATATFTLPGGGTVITSNEVQPGLNNDFVTSGQNCCDATDVPAFTMQGICDNGVYKVTATGTDPDPVNHSWALMQTSTAGNTTDAATMNGGTPLASAQGAASATFNITDLTKFYYIKHSIWRDGCYTTREQRIPVTLLQPTNMFNFEDAAHVSKTSFCIGEDIYLNGAASNLESRYSIVVSRRLTGTSAAFALYATLGWVNGTVPVVNFSQQLAGLSTPKYFDPLYDYSVKLMVSDEPNCRAVAEKSLTFAVACCTNAVNANFGYAVQVSSNSYAIKVNSFNTYANANAVHEWYLLRSNAATGGPYTPLMSIASAAQTELTLLTNATVGYYYTIIHKVKTKCGEVCLKRVQYSAAGKAADGSADLTSGEADCCLAAQYWLNGVGTAPQSLNAEFQINSASISAGSTLYTITASFFNTYAGNSTITHEWYLLSSTNATGGPYIPVAQGYGSAFTYAGASDDLYYFIVHKVKSPCGDICYGRSICHNCKATDESCELCRAMDCGKLAEVWPSCITPGNLSADCRTQKLQWAEVAGAAGYQVEVNFNDPLCCNSRTAPTSRRYDVTANMLDLSSVVLGSKDCFRWRVLTVCSTGGTTGTRSQSAWSNWLCSSCAPLVISGPITDLKAAKPAAAPVSAAIEPHISPNPNHGEMSLQLTVSGKLTVSVEAFNAHGVLVKTIKQQEYADGIFNAKLKLGAAAAKGSYLIIFKTNYGTYRKWIIVQ